jgi:hypothetical protein
MDPSACALFVELLGPRDALAATRASAQRARLSAMAPVKFLRQAAVATPMSRTALASAGPRVLSSIPTASHAVALVLLSPVPVIPANARATALSGLQTAMASTLASAPRVRSSRTEAAAPRSPIVVPTPSTAREAVFATTPLWYTTHELSPVVAVVTHGSITGATDATARTVVCSGVNAVTPAPVRRE